MSPLPRELALAEYLHHVASLPFEWGGRTGGVDCSLCMADWVLLQRGVDPAAPLRGRYRTAIGARRHIRRAGGIEAMGRALASAAGLAVTDAPRPGDIGLARHPDAGPLFAILTALGWAAKSPTGIALGRWPVLVAWTV